MTIDRHNRLIAAGWEYDAARACYRRPGGAWVDMAVALALLMAQPLPGHDPRRHDTDDRHKEPE